MVSLYYRRGKSSWNQSPQDADYYDVMYAGFTFHEGHDFNLIIDD